MKLGFERIMKKYDLDISELPKITQVEIKELTSLRSLVESKITIGQNVTQSMQSIHAKDNAIIDDLINFINEDFEEEEDSNEEDNSNKEEEDSNEEDDSDDSDEADGTEIDQELNNLFNSGATNLGLSQLRNDAPVTYECLYETYGKDEKNGIKTSNFTIIETSPNSETFKILKR